jgi:hypothetical protein
VIGVLGDSNLKIVPGVDRAAPLVFSLRGSVTLSVRAAEGTSEHASTFYDNFYRYDAIESIRHSDNFSNND